MRLELNIVQITKAQFADATAVRNGVLCVNRQELEDLVKQDTRLTDVDIELANPGDKCRIVNVADVIEPRARIAGRSISRRQGPPSRSASRRPSISRECVPTTR